MTSDDFGTLTLEYEFEGKRNDYQLWLINPETGLIQNKRTGMYLTTDFEGNVRTREYTRNDFNRWKILLPNETYPVPSKLHLNTPFGNLEI